MRRAAMIVCAVLVTLQVTRAQTPQRSDTAPVRRVVLYKNGVGYFEHVGKVRGNETVAIAFNSSQLDDVLKTLTVVDLGGGRVAGVSYNSEAPLAERLGSLRLPVGEHTTLAQLLDALRGARFEVRTGDQVIVGRLLSVEQHARTREGVSSTATEMTLVVDGGELRVVEITPATSVKLAERETTDQVSAYMGLLASERGRDRRLLKIATAGTGERDLVVGYISEVPVWKTTYRVVLPSRGGAPQLQAWAIVDNTIGEDWQNVELSLVAGAPQSFLQALSQPLYAQRPVVPLPKSLLVAPQTHQGTLTSGMGGISGKVSDASGAELPGVTVTLVAGGRDVAQTTTNAVGQYAFDSVLPGRYSVSFALAGFSSRRDDDVPVDGGQSTELDAQLAVGSLAENIAVPRDMNALRRRSMGPVPAAPAAATLAPSRQEIEDRVTRIQPAAEGEELGDLFEYHVSEPISIARNQSALVPILRHDVAVDRVSLWNARVVGGRPLRSLWLTNSSGSTLDGGSFTVLDGGAFAGEGLLDAMKPGEKRLLSYAVDLGVQVEPRNGDERQTIRRVTIARGVLVQQSEQVATRTYTIRNNDTAERHVVIEHPIRQGWKLSTGPTPAETASDAYRFVIVVPAKKTESLTVTEIQPVEQSFRIAEIGDQQLDILVRQFGGDTALKTALAPVIAARAALSAVNADLAAHTAEIKRIADEQQRIRQNMSSLRNSADEQQLLKRYIAQLGVQEDRMETLRRESDELERKRRDAQAELARQIDTVSAQTGR